MFDVTRFWYKRGVAGFRLDAVDTFYERSRLTDNPIPRPAGQIRPTLEQVETYNTKLPEVHDAMRELRKVADEYNAVLIGETWTADISELKRLLRPGQRRTANAHGFDFHQLPKCRRQAIPQPDRRRERCRLARLVISNHDIVRSYTRYADGAHNDEIAKMMAAMYLTLRGPRSCTTAKKSAWRTTLPNTRKT